MTTMDKNMRKYTSPRIDVVEIYMKNDIAAGRGVDESGIDTNSFDTGDAGEAASKDTKERLWNYDDEE